jgi:predicted nuclease of predicted toxin-antitoxin system
MPLSPSLAKWLCDQGHDALHALAVGLDRAPDTEIMQRAVAEQRAIITADLDYPRLLASTRASAPGLVLFRGGDWSEAEVIARLQQVLGGVDEADIAGSILVIDRERVRRRRLPIT